jgi:hypothetical protein
MEGKNMYETILNTMHALLKDEFENVTGDLGGLEQAVLTTMLSLGNGLLQRLLEQGSKGYQGSSMPCRCGHSMRFIQHREKDLHTLFGWVKIRRAYYHCCRCGHGVFPYDTAVGMGPEQLSPGLAKAACLVAVDDSFQQTSRKLEALFGQRVSDTTIERVVVQVGSVVLAHQDQSSDRFVKERKIPESQNIPKQLYIAPDGTTVHEDDGWHEAKVGSIYWQDERLKRTGRYVGRFDNAEVFGRQLWLEACRCGFRDTDEVIYIGDGAGWIRTIHKTCFNKATFIVDWFHASEHIWDCDKMLFGEGTEATQRWVARRLSLLWEGWTRKLLNHLKKQSRQFRGSKREAIKGLIHYVSVNEEQMRYNVFRSKGYDIGSGAAEGACKYVVGKRLKQSGMIWSRTGSAATLALRIAWLNQDWESLWSRKPLVA